MPRSAAAASDARFRPRRACAAAAVLAAVLALAAAMPLAWAAPASEPVKIGIIGTGHIGGALARLWVQAGHEVLISSRHPDELKALAASLGPKARVGTPREAALFGDVVLVSVPYKALPQIGQDLKSELAGKIVLDTCNPYPERDRGARARNGGGVAAVPARRAAGAGLQRHRLSGSGARGAPQRRTGGDSARRR
jgi:hypothetical protein